MDLDTSSPFSCAFGYASDCIGLRFQNPLYRITELFTGSKLRRSIATVKAFGQQIVSNAQQPRSRLEGDDGILDPQSEYGNLIDSLMQEFDDSSIVADAALNMLSAGRDTTAQSLTWVFYLLIRHPSINQRLRQEVVAAFPPEALSHGVCMIDLADLQPAKLPYTTAVFYEALRLYPPVPFEIKQCQLNVTLPDGTFLPISSNKLMAGD